MKKYTAYLLACLLLSACYGIEKGSVKPTTFRVSIEEVHGTSLTFTIHPADENAWYAYTVTNEHFPDYTMSDAEVAEKEIEAMLLSYDHYYSQKEDNTARFSDIFCYQGTMDFTERFLMNDQKYRIVVFQIDPYKRVLCGGCCSMYCNTKAVRYSDLKFEMLFSGDTMRIVPSNPDATYFWDCQDTNDILEDYLDYGHYFRSLVYMFEDYHFINNLLVKGTVEWVFSRDDKTIGEGDTRSVMVAGYADGELNTALHVSSFIYHQDGIEIIENPNPYNSEL